MREKYYGLEGEEILKNAAQIMIMIMIMFHKNQVGKIVQVINLHTSLYHALYTRMQMQAQVAHQRPISSQSMYLVIIACMTSYHL